MKRKIQNLILFVLFIIPQGLFAQFTFQKTYTATGAASGHAGAYTLDGGYVFAAQAYVTGSEGLYLIKINNVGDTIWTRKYISGNLSFIPRALKESIDKKIMISGFVQNPLYFNAFYINTDSLGNILWIKIINNFYSDYGEGMISTIDSGFILFGATQAIGSNFVAYIIKTDQSGNFLWNKFYEHQDKLYPSAIEQTSDNGFIMCGEYRNPGGHPEQIHLLKIDSIGNVMWSYTYGRGTAYNVKQTLDGGYVTAGYNYIGSDLGIFLIKTNSNGLALWRKEYNTSTSDYVRYLEITQDSGFMMVGRTGPLGASDYFMIKTNMYGDTLWKMHYGTITDEVAYYVHPTADGGYIVGGNSNDSIYVLKTDSVGSSGCNQVNITFNVIDTFTVISSYASVSTGMTTWNVSNPVTSISSGGIISTLCSTVGFNEITLKNSVILLSPNPTDGNFTIKSNHTIDKGVIVIFDVFGQKVFEDNILNESKKEISLKNISAGIYFVKVFDGEKSYCKKLIVE